MGEMHEICMIHSLFVEFSAHGQQSESIEAKADEFCSELHEICMIHCKFKSKKKFGIFICSFRRWGIKKCVRPELIFLPMFLRVLFFFFLNLQKHKGTQVVAHLQRKNDIDNKF